MKRKRHKTWRRVKETEQGKYNTGNANKDRIHGDELEQERKLLEGKKMKNRWRGKETKLKEW